MMAYRFKISDESPRDVREWTIDEVRHLVRIANSMRETFNTGEDGAPLDLQAIADLHFTALDDGAEDFESLYVEQKDAARVLDDEDAAKARKLSLDAWNRAVASAAKRRAARGKRANRTPNGTRVRT